MTAQLAGNWDVVKSDNMDGYLRGIGFSAGESTKLQRVLDPGSTPAHTEEVRVNGDKLTLIMHAGGAIISQFTYTLGAEPVEDKIVDGRFCKTNVYKDGNAFCLKKQGDNWISIARVELVGEQMVVTLTANPSVPGGGVCVRTYKRVAAV